MTIQNTLREAGFISKISEIALSKGVHLQTGEDFTDYAEMIARERADQMIGPPFDCSKRYIAKGSGLWITGRNDQGELVHTQAIRILDLEGMNLAAYLRKRFREFPPTGLDLDMPGSECSPGPGARRISGTVIYHGDVWLKGGENGYRGTGLSSLLSRFAMATALMRWAPDHMFAFMPRPIAFKGLAEREGYMHAEPGVLKWHLRNCADILEGFMVYMSREDLEFITTIPVHDMVA